MGAPLVVPEAAEISCALADLLFRAEGYVSGVLPDFCFTRIASKPVARREEWRGGVGHEEVDRGLLQLLHAAELPEAVDDVLDEDAVKRTLGRKLGEDFSP